MLDKKPKRFRSQPTKAAPAAYVHGLHHVSNKNIVFGSESNSHYVDVVSVGPIGGIKQVYLDETSYEAGEFPKSTIYVHDGDGPQNPWDGDFPFAERTITVGKSAEITEAGNGAYSVTEFTRRVVSLGVVGLRVNFTTSGFTQKDENNDEKEAKARFTVYVLSPAGEMVALRTSDYTYFSARNPTAVQININPPEGYENTHWEYRVKMEVRGKAYRASASGNWAASTVTEIYKDTQTYNKIAYSSGTIVASDVSGSIPMRQYLTDGYKVQVPLYQTIGGNQVMTGEFTRRTSDSPAWNAMAVLTDETWGAGLPLDKIDIVSFEEFDKYCTKELVNNSQRYLFSHYLIKSDNYYKLASEMVGSADGKLYEDTSGRIGVLIDRQSDNRRVITSYDIVNENVKRTTVTDNKRTNYVEVEFADRDNLYKKTIINETDQDSIDKNGVVSSKLKLDTCTRLSEAEMVAKKILATSQYSTSSYSFKVGNTHEDIQIGEIVELYDRRYSNINYCGKIASGSTTTEIVIDPRTPINLEGIKTPLFTIDNARGVPIRVPITSWTSLSIVLSTPLTVIPRDFTSFGIYDADDTGTKPTLIRILGVDDSSGTMALEGVEYNDSLQDYVEIGSPLVIHNYRYTPEQQVQELTGLVLIKNLGGLTASWDNLIGGYEFAYIWKVTPIGSGTITVVKQGIATTNSTALPNPLVEGTYQVQVAPVLNGEQVGDFSVTTMGVSASVGSILPAPTGLSVLLDDGSASTEYTSDFFKLQWDQVEQVDTTTVSHFKLKLLQNGLSKEIIVDGTERSYNFSNTSLTEYFGDYIRQFTVELLAVDSVIRSTALSTVTIDNPAPPAPMLAVDNTGSITLSYSPSIPTDVIGSRTVLWEGFDTNESAPVDAKVIVSANATNISIPEGYVRLDGTSYVFDVAWIDGFGESVFHTKELFSFDPDIIIPTPPVLTTITPFDSQSVIINFTHDGLYLKNIKASYKKVGGSTWIELAGVSTVPPSGTNNTFDQLEGTGTINVSGLVRNFEYEFKLVSANVTSGYSEDSNIIIGSPYLDVLKPDDIPNLDDIISNAEIFDPRVVLVEGVSDVFGEGANKASIITAQQAIVTETTARATAIQQLTAVVGENTATIINTQDALATETSARVVAVSELTASVGDNTASIVNAQQAIVNETDARASSIEQLTVNIGDDIALVDQAAKAAIGYCTIGGNPSSHETKILCETAGGTWVNSTLASATRTVQVSSGGNTATVGDFYQSYIDLEGNVNGKAVIGVDVNGTWTGMSIVGGNSYSKITFKGNAVEFQTATGSPALYWNSTDNTWVFNGRLVVGGYTVNSEADIRSLDGDTIYEVYQYSVNGSTNWHDTYTTGDIFRRTATVTNGVQGAWSVSARITGTTPAIRNNPDGSYTISNGTEEATIYDGTNAPIPTAVDNGDGTYTITDGEGNSVTVSNGENGSTPIKGIDYFDGKDGSFVSNIYTTSSTGTPSKPVGGSFNGSSEVVPSGYQDAPYFEVGKVTYISTTRYSQQSNGSWIKSGWSAPAEYIIKGEDGSDGATGATGAGFYGSTYAAISWTTSTANSRFLALVGRNPVNLDIFTQTLTTGTDSQARQYNGSSWVAVALQINGSIVASGTIAGDRLVAGTEMTAPYIKGGRIEIGSRFTVDANGNMVANYGTMSNATVTGTINANAGVFNNVTINENCDVKGTIYANKIVGDVVSAITKTVTTTRQQEKGISAPCLTGTVLYTQPYNRTLIVGGLYLTFKADSLTYNVIMDVRLVISFGGVTSYSNVMPYFMNGSSTRFEETTVIPVDNLSITVPANRSGVFTVQLEMVERYVNRYPTANYVEVSAAAPVPVLLYRNGNGLS